MNMTLSKKKPKSHFGCHVMCSSLILKKWQELLDCDHREVSFIRAHFAPPWR
jgi:hypothetical protein